VRSSSILGNMPRRLKFCPSQIGKDQVTVVRLTSEELQGLERFEEGDVVTPQRSLPRRVTLTEHWANAGLLEGEDVASCPRWRKMSGTAKAPAASRPMRTEVYQDWGFFVVRFLSCEDSSGAARKTATSGRSSLEPRTPRVTLGDRAIEGVARNGGEAHAHLHRRLRAIVIAA